MVRIISFLKNRAAAGWPIVNGIRNVAIGSSTAAPGAAKGPAAYSKLIAYAVAALITLGTRWTGVEVSPDLSGIIIELAISFVGGWAVWRVPNGGGNG